MNPPHEDERDRRAVALRYDPELEGAPRVVATGRGCVAEAILAAARESGVPVREHDTLAGLLVSCELGDEIPEELYEVVAEVLAWLSRIDGAAKEDASHMP